MLFYFLGRISAISKADILPLIKVFKRLLVCNQDKKLTLFIAGSEEAGYRYFYHIREYCQKLGISDRVIIKDKVSYKEKRKIIQCSRYIHFPNR